MRPVHTLFPLVAALLALAIPATASAKALRAPTLATPAAAAKVESIPALTWGAVRGAVAYEYQLAADPGFGSIVLGSGFGLGASRTANTAASLTAPVPDGEYFWRVRAIDRNDRAGRWSDARTLTKAWTTAPLPLEPADQAAVQWPAAPLVLRWTAVPLATKYIVTIATDPSMSNPVLGIARDPVKTQGTNFAYQGALAPGSYYWAITPVDADGHPGQRSAVRKFEWKWPTTTTATVADANASPSVYDPLFSWDPVPGAAAYEIDVNPSHDWSSSSRVCCTDPTVGTSLSPKDILRNNVYFWRVRAIDAAGNAGLWNEGPSFQKDFDPVVPSIPNLRVRDRTNDTLPPLPTTSSPVIAWDPVPGASSYSVETVKYLAGSCDWSAPSHDDTAATMYTYGSGVPGVQGPISVSIANSSDNASGLVDGTQYCVRTRARSDRVSDDNGFVSDWTQINGLGQPAFQFQSPALVPGVAPDPFAMPPASYKTPISGSLNPRLPLFSWDPVPGANGYWVIVSRDASFTTIADYAFTRFTQYAPGSGRGGSVGDIVTYTDETTKYYWVVIPATGSNGSGASTVPAQNSPQQFDKNTVPPALLAPASDAVVPTQPTFRWTTSEGARRFRLQVSQDPTFGNPIDDVVSASTAYTSSTTYPADTKLYWRVAGIDENGVSTRRPLNWSPTGTFELRLRVPALLAGTPVAGSGIPVLSWGPVPGAISYDLHADWVNGRSSDATVSSTAFTPTSFYGNGIWRWKVRANFPTSRGNAVSGGYFAAQEFTRRMDRTPNVRGTKTSTRVLLSWDPDPAAATYRVEISRTNGFGQTVDRIDTKTTSFAPDLSRGSYADGGTLYWRVASVDEGRNIGAWTTGTFVFPKRLAVTVAGFPRKGQRGVVRVVVRGANRRPVRGARVRMNGRGVPSAARRTNSDGMAVFSVRPRRASTLTFTVTRKGYRDAVGTVRVR